MEKSVLVYNSLAIGFISYTILLEYYMIYEVGSLVNCIPFYNVIRELLCIHLVYCNAKTHSRSNGVRSGTFVWPRQDWTCQTGVCDLFHLSRTKH